MFTSTYEKPSHFILHFSDIHLVAGDELLYGDVDSEARIRQLFLELEQSEASPEAIIFTGDIADRGQAEAYQKIKAMIDPLATKLGAEVIWLMGNHDDRASFRQNLLGQESSTEPVDEVHDINGLRIITLDTSVPGYHYGDLTAKQLDWLEEILKTKAPHGTLLAMHHPPIPSVQDLSVTTELRNQKALAEIIKGSDIRSIIAGHLHYSSHSTFAGIPVSVVSATCYTQDLNTKIGGIRGRDGAQAFNLVHVYDEIVLHSVVPIDIGKTVGEPFTPEQVKIILSEKDVPKSY